MLEYQATLNQILHQLTTWFTSTTFYIQVGIVVGAFIVAFALSPILRRKVNLFRQPPDPAHQYYSIRQFVYSLQELFLPFITVCVLSVAVGIAGATIERAWLVRVVQALVVVWLLYKIISRYVTRPMIRRLCLWIGLPVATLIVFDRFGEFTAYLDGFTVALGNINVSLLAIARGLIFGYILYWLGMQSNVLGKKAIQKNASLDVSTKELLSKGFEVSLFVILSLLLLQIIGINLTTLAVFGGAVGVGLGFGLQQIASNFISGVIILLDRSIIIGDHVELEDGRFGIIRQMQMRYATLETYEGKEVMIPNETFITTAFTNWSNKNDKQRYDFIFGVAYDTDLHFLFDLVRKILREHPQVISGDDVPIEEQPDCEINDFGDSSVNILVEFWMHGIDDGKNRVGADLKLAIWDALKEHNITIPFPQREVRLLNYDQAKLD